MTANAEPSIAAAVPIRPPRIPSCQRRSRSLKPLLAGARSKPPRRKQLRARHQLRSTPQNRSHRQSHAVDHDDRDVDQGGRHLCRLTGARDLAAEVDRHDGVVAGCGQLCVFLITSGVGREVLTWRPARNASATCGRTSTGRLRSSITTCGMIEMSARQRQLGPGRT